MHCVTRAHTGARYVTRLLKQSADSVIDPDDVTSPHGRMLPEQEVGCKDAHEGEVLLAAQPHDGQSCLNTHCQIPIGGALHLGDL